MTLPAPDLDVVVLGGGGHVGLPLSLVLAQSGLRVGIYDTNEATLERIASGDMPFLENGADALLGEVLMTGRLEFASDGSMIERSDTLVVVIGTPTAENTVAAFRDGWMLSVIAFFAVAVVSLPLGRLEASTSSSEDDAGQARVDPPLMNDPPGSPPASRSAGASEGKVSRDLSAVGLVAHLPEDARRQLEQASRLVTVPAGSWLMREGDPPGSAYVVHTGRLEVLVGERLVRELGQGAVLGELALLTGEPRSASVRARRDTVLLEIPRDAFEQLVADHSTASRAVLTQVAERLRTVGAPGASAHPERCTHDAPALRHPDD